VNRRELSKFVGLGALGASAAATFAGASPAAAATAKGGHKPEKVLRANRRAWAKEHFRGFENAHLVSFTPDMKKLDEHAIRLDIQKAISHGFFSTLLVPTSLTTDELKRYIDISVEEAQGKISIALALHGANEAEMMERLHYAENAGVQHILVDLPRTGTAQELIAFGNKYAEATNMGIYLWMAGPHNFKRFHPSGIPYEVFDKLVEQPNIIALKVGDMDGAVIFDLLERYNDKMLIGALMPNLMPLAIKGYGQQWSGAWTVEAIQSPEQPVAVEFFNLMMAGKYDAGMKLYWQYVKPGFAYMMKTMGPLMPKGGHPWEHMKLFQYAVGGNGGRYRVDPDAPDLPTVTAENIAEIRGSLIARGIKPADEMSIDSFAVGRAAYAKGARAKA